MSCPAVAHTTVEENPHKDNNGAAKPDSLLKSVTKPITTPDVKDQISTGAANVLKQACGRQVNGTEISLATKKHPTWKIP